MTSTRWEFGSDFPWMGVPQGSVAPWPRGVQWYATGRGAISAILRATKSHHKPRIWLPSYFCFDSVRSWKQLAQIETYTDSPQRNAPQWESLRCRPGNFVLFVNYFGARDGHEIEHWASRNECLTIEDHTHDPLSAWALRSRADFAFASVRKTCPVPDGAVLWSPQKRELPTQRVPPASDAVLQRLTAMLMKQAYLQPYAQAGLKPMYRQLYALSEECLESCAEASASMLTTFLLREGMPDAWRRRREGNVRTLLGALTKFNDAQPLFRAWPEGHAPLGLVLVFPGKNARDACRKRLIAEHVYCPVHWPEREQADAVSRKLAARVLTIPADQRYSREDMLKVAAVICG